MPADKSDLLHGTLDFIVLKTLHAMGPLHGYALMKAFAARSGIRISIGNVYRELARLRNEGHIKPVENPSDADPRRLPYAYQSDSDR